MMQRFAIPVVYVISAAILMALSGQTALFIPGIETPITWQSMLAILLPLIFPRREAVIGVLVFLIAGALGSPVFANGNGGYEIFLSTSGGYLIGFLIISIISGFFKNSFKKGGKIWAPFALFFGLQILLSIIGNVFIIVGDYGDPHFLPFLTGIIIKSFIGWGVFVVFRIMKSDYRKGEI